MSSASRTSVQRSATKMNGRTVQKVQAQPGTCMGAVAGESRLLVRLNGQGNMEDRTLPHLAFNPDTASVSLHCHFAESQAKSGRIGAAGMPGSNLPELIEDVLERLGRDTLPCIADGQVERFGRYGSAKTDTTGPWSELNGIP